MASSFNPGSFDHQASAAHLHHSIPCLGTSPQWTNAGEALGFEEQRRTGAGSFVRSTAIQNDLPVARNLLHIAGDVLEGEADRPGYGGRIAVRCRAQIDDVKIFA